MSEKRNNISEEESEAEKTAEVSAAAGIRRFYAEQTDLVLLKQRFTAFLMKHGSGKNCTDDSAGISASYSARMETAEEIWEMLNSRYMEPRRYYHSWGHIAFMLQLMDRCRNALAADHFPLYPVPFEAAVWFHDAVQFSSIDGSDSRDGSDGSDDSDGSDGEDERRSADLAVRLLRRTGMQIDYVLRTADLIRSTEPPRDSAAGTQKKKSGGQKEEYASGRFQDADAELLHDIDYAVLGTSEKLFLHYEQAVRLEYSHLSDEAYAAGRSSFLRTLLREGVFRTEYFTAQYEDQALNNIRMQLECFGKFSGRG